jgi:hypothetical protein
MTPDNFCYWLQGYFEISGNTELTQIQAQDIKNHLQLVFRKETPNLRGETVTPYNNVQSGPPNSTGDPRIYGTVSASNLIGTVVSC